MPISESESASFAALVMPHTPTMLRVAGALIGIADAEDAAQEAILMAWQAWSQLRDHNALRSWLLRITVNVCQQWLRGEMGKRKRLTMPLLDESAEWIPALGGDPGDSDHADALDVRRALMQLKSDLRTVIVLRYYGGLDVMEIGVALGLPAGTVRTRLRRAYTILRDQLATPLTIQEDDFHV